jgi:hypothetical protein
MMIVRLYKKHYLGLDEQEMTALDGLIDGLTLVMLLVMTRAFFNLVIL